MAHDLPLSSALTHTTPAPGVIPNITIVGAGHAMVPHDRVGPRVIELLRQRQLADVDLRDVGTSGLELLDHFAAQDLLLIVDACVGMGEPGEIVETEPDLESAPTPSSSVHQVGPVEALLVAKHLYPERLPKRVRLMLVETANIDDRAVERACHRLVEAVEREIRQMVPTARRECPSSRADGGSSNMCEHARSGQG